MSGEEKYNTCLFRSSEEVKKIIKRCSCKGGNYEKVGFFCNKKQLFDVNATDCEGCDQYKNINE